MSTSTLFFASILILSYLSIAGAQGTGTSKCADTGLDWYTGKVGETPCKTYERLRQICNSNFRVGQMNPNTPPDFCNEQVANCCCNNIAFSLAMLCLTCQQGVGTSGNGIDAGVGAYQQYLTGSRTNKFCAPQTNKTLPADVQSAVCNNKINIYDDLYSIMWDDGQWFYIFMSQSITKDQNANPDKVFTKCPKPSSSSQSSSASSTRSTSTTSGSPSTTSSASSTSNADNSSNSSKSLGTGAIAGIAIGVVIATLAAALGLFFWCRRKKRLDRERYISTSGLNIDGSNGGPPPPAPQMYTYTPVAAQTNTSQRTTQMVTTTPTPGGYAPQTGTSSYFHDSSSSQGYPNSSHAPYSPTSNSGYPSTHPPTSGGSQAGYAPSLHPQSIAGGSHSGSSGGGGDSSRSYNTNESRTGFIVSNPDGSSSHAASNSSSVYSRSDRLTSPYSPTSGSGSGGASFSGSASTAPHPSSLPGKASLNMRNTRYVPPEAGEMGERHVDAGPVPGVGLSRNPSGRLPPAYGDLVRES